MDIEKNIIPEILAPAGDTDCFLAALAAGANGIYLGLKNFSARMQAKNFGIEELARLIELAHSTNCKVYVAMNNLLKQKELEPAYRLTRRLASLAQPDGLIIQDLAMIDIARQADFRGTLAFSTLANISAPADLACAKELGADMVIVPRELSLDELMQMGEACPPGLGLECFVHGALCYCVSGRCYWSSYMGGKSGLRGRCVQPCRRVYARETGLRKGQKTRKKRAGERYFSCQDLELLPVVRKLLRVPNLVSWKIEGRKKGPHYVYHAVLAYRILRDQGEYSQQRKMAQELLEYALGRPGVRARFLPQRKYQPMAPFGQTSSGLLAGKIRTKPNGEISLKTHIELLPKDYLRVGVEDESWHETTSVSRAVPKAGELKLGLAKHKIPPAGTPVYLIDRREPALLSLISEWRRRLAKIPKKKVEPVKNVLELPAAHLAGKIPDMVVRDQFEKTHGRALSCIWLSSRSIKISPTLYSKTFFWLPPAIFPEDDDRIKKLIMDLWKNGARQFVCNSPWQRGFFPELLSKDALLIAGPFCNIANSLAVMEIAKLGYQAAFVSPELSQEDFLILPKTSPLPLGLVIAGNWPVGLSRFGLIGLESGDSFESPRLEKFWSANRAGLSWIFPAWPLDLTDKRKMLEKAGYSFFAILEEKNDKAKADRPGLFNWEGKLL